MQSKNAKSTVKKITAVTLAVPLAISSLAVPGLGEMNQAQAAVEASGVPTKVKNATIDWDTFSHEAISLVWDANPDATGYIIERNGVEVYNGKQARFDDTGLASGASYQYAIYAYNANGLSVPNIDQIETDAVYQTVVVNWLPAENIEEFLIERNGKIIASVPGNIYTYSDELALVGNEYLYKIIPLDAAGDEMPAYELPPVKPEIDKPTIIEPTEKEPTDEEPTEKEPTEKEPTEKEPTEKEPTDEEPTEKEPADEEPTDEEPTEKEPTEKEPTDEEPTEKEPTDEEPTEKEPTDEEPTEKEPTDEEPTEKEPTDEEPTEKEPTEKEPEDLDTSYEVKDVIYGPTFLEIGWYPMLGAVGYWIFLNGELVHDQLEDGSPSYHYRADDLVASEDNVLELVPYDKDGNSIGDGVEIPFPPTDGLETFTVFADVVGNDVTVSWDVGELEATAYKVLIRDMNDNVVDSKEYTYAGATQHIAKIEKAGLYVASVAPMVNGEYLGAIAADFVIEQDFVENKAPVAPNGGLENIHVTIGEAPFVKELNEVFHDPEGGELTYSIILANTNASALIQDSQLTVVGNVQGMTSATLTITDKEGNETTQNLIIYVQKPVNKAPIIEKAVEDIVMNITDAPKVFNAAEYFSDPEGGNVVVTLGTISNSNVEVKTDGTNITFTPKHVGETKVQLVGNDSEGAKITISFTVTVKEVAPITPTNFTAIAIAHDEVQLTFDKVEKAKKYIIYRDGELVTETTSNTYLDKNLTAQTAYLYSVIAVNAVGQSEPVVASVTTPEVPKIENLTADVTGQTIVLNWDAFANSNNRYKVFRYIENDDGTLTLNNYGQTVYSNTYTDTNLKGDTKYQYKVFPFVIAKSDYKEEYNSTVSAKTEVINLAPTVLKAIPKQELKENDAPKTLDLTEYFVDPNGDELTFKVVNVSNSHVTATVNGNELTITPNDVGSSEIVLKAVDPKGLSIQQKLVIDLKVATPTAVENLKLDALSHSSVQVSFDASEKATSYIIKRDGVEIKRTTETSFTDTGLEANTKYNYEVIALNDSGRASTEGSVTTQEMSVVKNVKAEMNGIDQAKITWDAYGNTTRYRVVFFTRNENGDFVQNDSGRTTTATQIEYKSLAPETEYYFGVTPYVDDEQKDEFMGLSNTITTLKPVEPEAPKNVQLDVTLDGTTANLTITPLVVDDTTITEYRLYLHEKLENGDYKQIGTPRLTKDLTELTQVYENLTPGVTYKFTVQPRVKLSYGNTDYHGMKEVTVSNDVVAPPTEPEEIAPDLVPIKDVQVTIDANNQATVTWQGFGEATRFKVWRYIENVDGTYKLDNYGPGYTGTTYADPNKLQADTKYLYVIVPLKNNSYPPSAAKGGYGTTGGNPNAGNDIVLTDKVSNIQYTKSGNNAIVNWDKYNTSTRYKVESHYLAADGTWKVHRTVSVTNGLSGTIALKVGAKNKIVVKPWISNFDNAFFGESEPFQH